MKGNGKKLVVVLLAAIVLSALAAPPVVAEEKAARSVSTTNPSSNEEFDVMLTVGFQIGGIVETIPDGFTFVSTAHPPEQCNVSGQNIRFVVINEPEIKYSVEAPSSGSGTFKGVWADVLSATNGTLADTNVAIRSANGEGGRSVVTPSVMLPLIIVAIVVAAVVVIGVATYFPVFKRKGKEKRGDKK